MDKPSTGAMTMTREKQKQIAKSIARKIVLEDIVYETEQHWVRRLSKGFEVYRNGSTNSVRVAQIDYEGIKGLNRAIAEIESREA